MSRRHLNVNSLLIASCLLLFSALPAAAWEYLGMADISATCIVADPQHDRVFVGTYEGFWYYDQVPGLWTERDWEDWIGRQVHAIDWHDDLDQRVITGRENAWFKGYIEYSDDLGATEVFVYESQGGEVTDLNHDDLYHYACTWSDIAPGEFLRSANGGESWTLIGNPQYAMTDIEVDPQNGNLYLAGTSQVMRSENHGDNWESIAGDLPAGEGVYCLAAPNHGDVWPELDLLAGTDSGIYQSYDGVSWVQRLPEAGRSLAAYPASDGPVAAVTWGGQVYLSRDGGVSWLDFTDDLPGTPKDVCFSRWDGGIYVVTNSQGVYRIQDVVTGLSENPVLPPQALRAFPNPFNPATTLRFELAAAGPVRLSIHDVRGRQLDCLVARDLPAGAHSVLWWAEDLPSGVYLARLVTPAATKNLRLVLLK